MSSNVRTAAGCPSAPTSFMAQYATTVMVLSTMASQGAATYATTSTGTVSVCSRSSSRMNCDQGKGKGVSAILRACS